MNKPHLSVWSSSPSCRWQCSYLLPSGRYVYEFGATWLTALDKMQGRLAHHGLKP